MSLFTDFVEGFTSGLASVLTEQASRESAGTSHSGGVVEECCRQLGWSIDERLNANEVYLHFNDSLIRIRKVLVSLGNQGATVSFTVFSAVSLPARQVPAEALGYLLKRNGEMCLAWQMRSRDDGNVSFALSYLAVALGLQHGTFKTICETMVREAHEFDERMNEAGLLR